MDRTLQDLFNAPLQGMTRAQNAQFGPATQGMTQQQRNAQFGSQTRNVETVDWSSNYNNPDQFSGLWAQHPPFGPHERGPWGTERMTTCGNCGERGMNICKHPPIDWYRVQEIVWALFGIILAMLYWT